MVAIKAIETIYNGYRFRSRLEARWAVFFDTLGIKYEYEKEGFELEGKRYLPDFWLPDLNIWIEIKGDKPTKEEEHKAGLLALYTRKRVYIFSGQIPMPPKDDYSFMEDGADVFFGYGGDEQHNWCECPTCHVIGIEYAGMADRLCDCHSNCKVYGFNSPRLITAYTAARQARFEHHDRAAKGNATNLEKLKELSVFFGIPLQNLIDDTPFHRPARTWATEDEEAEYAYHLSLQSDPYERAMYEQRA